MAAAFAEEADDDYPQGPAVVPAVLDGTAVGYRRRAWVSAAAVALFLAAYAALIGWFGWTGVTLLRAAWGNPEPGVAMAIAALALLVAGLLVLAVVAMPRARAPEDDEVREAEHPRLHAFVRRIAAEVGAPVPERIAVNASVDVAVVAEIGLASLIVPPRRSLVIGLGLVEVATRGELKAAIARELALVGERIGWAGRWSQVGQVIARRLITRHDWIDRALAACFGYHAVMIAVSVVGMVLVWGVRALTETLFGWMLWLERGMARARAHEADRAAVAVCGSEALVGLLRAREVAADALAAARGFAMREEVVERPIADLFAVQGRFVTLRRRAHGERAEVAAPVGDPYRSAPAEQRPPRSWTSPPPDHEREADARRWDVEAPRDDRGSWALFGDAAAVRLRATSTALWSRRAPLQAPVDVTLARLDALAARPHLAPRYRGVFLDGVFLDGAGPGDAGAAGWLHAASEATSGADVAATKTATATADADAVATSTEADGLYPAALAELQATVVRLAREVEALDALARDVVEARGRTIRHRGVERRRKELPALIEATRGELTAAREAVGVELARAHAAHLAAARRRGGGWEVYLRSLSALVHYAAHGAADVRQALGTIERVLGARRPGRAVTGAAFGYLVGAGNELTNVLHAVQRGVAEVGLPAPVVARLARTPWKAAFAPQIWPPPPYGGNLGEWLDATLAWTRGFAIALEDLRDAALDELLVQRDACARGDDGAAPPAAQVPADHRGPPVVSAPREPAMDPWTRIRAAEGPLVAAGRFAAAVVLVGGIAFAAVWIRGAIVTIYNGLGTDVTVTVGGETVTMGPGEHRRVRVGTGTVAVHARNRDGDTIERFEARAGDQGTYLYNVAAAMPVFEYEAWYGDAGGREGASRWLPAVRWQASYADHLFVEPPAHDRDGKTVTVVTAAPTTDPFLVTRVLDEDAARVATEAHARWDDTTRRHFAAWWWNADEYDLDREVLVERLLRDPDDPMLRQLERTHGDRNRDEVCEVHRALAAAQPDAPGWQAQAILCTDDVDAAQAMVHAALARWSDEPWVVRAAGWVAARRGDYAAADRYLTRACHALPADCPISGLDVVRVRRAAAGPGVAAKVDDLVADASLVDAWAVPDGDTWQDVLTRGELERAAAAADGSEQRGAAIWLVAGSDGATREQIARALAERDPPNGFRLGAYAVRRRAGQADTGPDLVRAVEAHAMVAGLSSAQADQLLAFFEIVTRDGPLVTAGAEAALVGLDPFTVGLAYAAAVVMVDTCPAEWRLRAKALTFVGERPYFR